MNWKCIALALLTTTIATGCRCDSKEEAATKQASTEQKAEKAKGAEARPSVRELGLAQTLKFRGEERRYTVHLPGSSDPKKRLPVLTLLLNANQEPGRFQDQANIITGAKKLGYLLTVIPVPEREGQPGWHAELCGAKDDGKANASATPTTAASSGKPAEALAADAAPGAAQAQAPVNDDAAWVEAVLNDVSRKHRVDPSRVTVLGVGDSATMAQVVADQVSMVDAVVEVSPREACAAPPQLVAQRPVRSLFIAADGGDSAWMAAMLDSRLTAGQCDKANKKSRTSEQTTFEEYKCGAGGPVEYAKVDDATVENGWPQKVGKKTFTMRYLHNFLRRK